MWQPLSEKYQSHWRMIEGICLDQSLHRSRWCKRVRFTQGGHKLRFFKGGKAQFVTVGIIYSWLHELTRPDVEKV